MMRGLQKGSKNRKHTRQCRDRIINELAKTSAGQRRIAKCEARKLFEKTLEKSCKDVDVFGAQCNVINCGESLF